MKRFGIAVVVLGLVAVAAVAYVAGSQRFATYRTDAKYALTLESRLCSRAAAFRGLVRARKALTRTTELIRDSKLLRTDDKGFYLWSTPHGEFWMPQKNDIWSLARVLAEQEQDIYGAPGGRGVHAGDIVLDGGAHVGLFTRTALAAGAAKVIAFEIAPGSLECLRRNLAKEIDEGKVVVVEKGVWHKEATLPIVFMESCSACSNVTSPSTKTSTTIEVPLTTIDNAVADLRLERVDFIKLDIENAEANALRGAHLTLSKYHPRVAVAIENAWNRVSYASQIDLVMRGAFAGYAFECGACTSPEKTDGIMPEVLHYYP